MNPIIHYLGLDVHKESIAVSIALAHCTAVRRYGIIGGTLDAVDKLVKKLSQPGIVQRGLGEPSMSLRGRIQSNPRAQSEAAPRRTVVR